MSHRAKGSHDQWSHVDTQRRTEPDGKKRSPIFTVKSYIQQMSRAHMPEIRTFIFDSMYLLSYPPTLHNPFTYQLVNYHQQLFQALHCTEEKSKKTKNSCVPLMCTNEDWSHQDFPFLQF